MMSFAPYPRLTDRVAAPMVSCDVRLIVVDEAEQLNKSGWAAVHALVTRGDRPCLLVGNERLLGRQRQAFAFVLFAFLRGFWRFRDRKGERDG
jgi:hypothetical protein